MFALAMRAAIGYVALTRWFPSNLALGWLRTRSGLKWAAPAALVLTPAYGLLGWWLLTLVQAGAPAWLALLAVVAFISAMKFVFFVPVSLALLARARVIEHRAAA